MTKDKSFMEEASIATGIPVEKLRSSKPLSQEEEILFEDWRAQKALAEHAAQLAKANPEIAERLGCTVELVEKVRRLSRTRSVAILNVEGRRWATSFRDLDDWRMVKKSVLEPLRYHLAEVQKLQERLWDDEFENPNLCTQALLRMELTEDEYDHWTDGPDSIMALVNRLLEIDGKAGPSSVPDWMRYAALAVEDTVAKMNEGKKRNEQRSGKTLYLELMESLGYHNSEGPMTAWDTH